MTRGEAIVAHLPDRAARRLRRRNLQLKARRDGDHYVINGEKTSITSADRPMRT